MAYYDSLSEATKKTAVDTLKAIETQFTGLENTHFQLHRLHNMRQKEGESVTDFTTRFQELARRAYADMGEKAKAVLMQAQYQNNLLPHIKRQILTSESVTDFTKTYKLALMIDSNPELYPPMSIRRENQGESRPQRQQFQPYNRPRYQGQYYRGNFGRLTGPYLRALQPERDSRLRYDAPLQRSTSSFIEGGRTHYNRENFNRGNGFQGNRFNGSNFRGNTF